MKRISLVWIAPDAACFEYNDAYYYSSKLIQDVDTSDIKLNSFYVCYASTKHTTPQGAKLYHLYSVEQLKKFFISSNSTSNHTFIILDSYRLPDRLIAFWVSSLALPNVSLIYLQHGRYTSLKRVSLTWHIYRKLFYYIRFLLLSVTNNIPFYLFKSNSSSSALFDYGFLYAPISYWQKYHFDKGYVFSRTLEIIDRDFHRFKISESYPRQPSILYIAQTLVEDGRCHYNDFHEFFSLFLSYSRLQNISHYIRLHPRSSKSIWDGLISEFNLTSNNFLSSSSFCRYTAVVTHNSALAFFFISNKVPVIFYQLSNEPIPMGLSESQYCIHVSNPTEYIQSIDKLLHLWPSLLEDTATLTSPVFSSSNLIYDKFYATLSSLINSEC